MGSQGLHQLVFRWGEGCRQAEEKAGTGFHHLTVRLQLMEHLQLKPGCGPGNGEHVCPAWESGP